MKAQYIEIDEDENKFYYSDKEMKILHREDGPAVEWEDGDKSWWLNGKHHREDGPASEWGDGGKFWFLNGERHREDGPAIERANGYKEWWLNDIQYSQIGFNKKMNLAPTININGQEFTVEELNSLIASVEK
jgi:hypothetical protein